MDGGVNGAKLQFVQKAYADSFSGKGNQVLCIITDKENVRTVAARDFVSKKGRKYQRLYQCRKPVKQYYIYVHDAVLGGPCYLKISSYWDQRFNSQPFSGIFSHPISRVVIQPLIF
jgi:hypothetical protein